MVSSGPGWKWFGWNSFAVCWTLWLLHGEDFLWTACSQALLHKLQAAGQLGLCELVVVSLCCEGLGGLSDHLVYLGHQLLLSVLQGVMELINGRLDIEFDSGSIFRYSC